jgi:glycosyltransferase involved in cell wall biosynthesis
VVGVLRTAQRLSIRSAHAVLVTNESQHEVVTALGARPGSVVIVRNGPRRETLSPDGAVRGGSLSDPRLVFVGTLASQDGVEELPAIMSALIGDHELRGAHLTVVGDGPARESMMAAFRAAGLASAVDWKGWVAHREVPRLLATADVCLDPAPCTDVNHKSTMIKIMEYLAAGRPIVAYDLLETRRTAGDAALYAPCGDMAAFAAQVARSCEHPELRRELADKAALRAGRLVWEHAEAALLSAYSTLRTIAR